MRIVFMGTPEFAVPSLAALLDEGFDVVGVFTQPDRPAGRGGKLRACPVKLLAESRGVEVTQVEKIRRADGLEALRRLAPDLCVTAAFGQILSQANLDVPRLGTVNVHASLLPRHRGAAPVNWAIWMGDKTTGVTTMFTDAGLDTGDMIYRAETEIGPFETAGELTVRLAGMGAALLVKTVRAVEAGTCPREKQNPEESTYEPMLRNEMGLLDFRRTPDELERQVRALNPWPGAFALLNGEPLKVWAARAADESPSAAPGTVVSADGKRGLVVACARGALELNEIQAANARRMDARDYLRGKAIPVGTVLNG